MFLDRQIERLRSRVERTVGIKFPGSRRYWERRYVLGGNSGSGSYGRLARFKAEFLNNFVTSHAVQTVIEFGCGDGHQLSLSRYPSYFGVDVSPRALSICRSRFASDSTKRFDCKRPERETFDLSLSLDVIYHLIEDDVYNSYMADLFSAGRSWVIIYSSNIHDFEFKNQFPEYAALHVKHRRVSRWVNENRRDWNLLEERRNPFPYDLGDPENTSFANFLVYQHCATSQTS